MSHVRWSTFRELEDVLNRYNRAVAGAGACGVPASETARGREFIARPDWSPSVDIVETASEFLVKAELPEVKKEDVKVSVKESVLTISGERRLEKAEGDIKHRRIERAYGSFRRSFTLPENADENNISADYKDGVLSLRIPKIEKSKPEAIEVKVH